MKEDRFILAQTAGIARQMENRHASRHTQTTKIDRHELR